MSTTKRKYKRVFTPTGGPSMTKQSFKDEVNINKIMAKFQKTGAIDHYAKYEPHYGDATPVQLHDAQNLIANAETMFEELPATIRKKFENDPAKFLEFVQDKNNVEEMVELGLRADHRTPLRENNERKSDVPDQPPVNQPSSDEKSDE